MSGADLSDAASMGRDDIAPRAVEINAESDAAVDAAQAQQAEWDGKKAEREALLENPPDATAQYVTTDDDGNLSASVDESAHMDRVMQESGLERDGDGWALADREHEGMEEAQAVSQKSAPDFPMVDTIVDALGTNNVVWADSPADTLDMDFSMFFSASAFAFAKLKKIPALKNSTLALGLNPRFGVSAGSTIGDLTGISTDGLGSMNVDIDPGKIASEWANMVSGWPKTEGKMPFALNSGVGSVISAIDSAHRVIQGRFIPELAGFGTDARPGAMPQATLSMRPRT